MGAKTRSSGCLPSKERRKETAKKTESDGEDNTISAPKNYPLVVRHLRFLWARQGQKRRNTLKRENRPRGTIRCGPRIIKSELIGTLQGAGRRFCREWILEAHSGT